MDFTIIIPFTLILIPYILRKKHCDALEKATLVERQLCQGKNDYKNGGFF